MSNMQLDDVLNILASVGTVSLRRIKNPVSATPGHTPHGGWYCECDVPGYHHNGGGKPILTFAGDSAQAAALGCLASIEEYLASDLAAEQRARYVKSHTMYKSLWDNATSEQRHCGFNRVSNPGALLPKATINYGD